MNDVIINVNEKTGVAYKKYLNQKLGNQHQNLQNKLKFEFTDNIPSGIAWLEYENDGNKNYALMEEYEKGYQIDINSCLLISDHVEVDIKITQDENPNGIPVFVSSIVTYQVEKTINAEEKEPDQYPSWFESANNLLNEFKDAIGNLGDGELTGNYENMINLPQINSVTLKGNKSFEDLGLREITNLEIDEMFKDIVEGND